MSNKSWDFPTTKYRMLYGGAWRPVTNMFDAHNRETAIVERTAKAVLFVDWQHWIAVTVAPGDIHVDPGYKTDYWETSH